MKSWLNNQLAIRVVLILLEAIGINTLKFGLFSQPFPKRVQIGLPSLRFGPYYLSPND